jgi:UDP-N-acetylmuramate--alanine ligase
MVGIGGIGMSALAQLYSSQGKQVKGSDRDTSPVTELLSANGITIYSGHAAAQVAPETDLLVYSAAVPDDNPERVAARERGIRELSYVEALGEATRNGVSVVVAGTHGKTTTTAMVAKMLIDAGMRPTVIAGSILSEYGSNFVAGKDDLFVIEGCEYRRHFLHLHPTVLVITNIDLDHTDYYRDLDDLTRAFHELAQRLPEQGTIVCDTTAPLVQQACADATATVVPYQDLQVPKLRTAGDFNILNARAAKCAVRALNPELRDEDLDRSLAAFTGTWRRFERKGVTAHGALVYDDYAHHPTAIRATLSMVRATFPDKRLLVVFHPHLYSRTASFFRQFAEALTLADEAILLPIYAAREKLDPSVGSEKLVEEVTRCGGHGRFASDFDAAKIMLDDADEHTLILTMGAGDVYHLADTLVEHAK